jgi:lipid II:glycine glycyltransferase (peptidoglycan interpeptide bridge formation enzyme)
MPYWAGSEGERAERLLRDDGWGDVQTFASAHASTLRIDLTRTDEELLMGKDAAQLRSNLKRAERDGATARIASAQEIDGFERLFGEVMRGQGHKTKPPEWFKALARVIDTDRASLHVCEHAGELVGASYVTVHGTMATLAYAATTSRPRSFSKLVLALRSAIRWARAHGCTCFDMGGIPMEGDTDQKRRQIATFKFMWGSTPIRLVHEHARWF